MEIWTTVAAIAGAVGSFLAAVAIWQTIKISRNQEKLSRDIHRQQMLLTQRQYLLPLWDHMTKLNDIDSTNPVWVDVINAVNILELVAICWEGQLIDENIIRRMFSKQYIEFYQRIEECRNPPANVRRDGKEMLLESRAATRLYRQLIDEHARQGELAPIDRRKNDEGRIASVSNGV